MVDVERLGYGETAFVLLGLASQQEHAQEEFEAAVEKIEEVMECHAVVGERVDYLIRVVACDTHDHLPRILPNAHTFQDAPLAI